MSVLDQPIIEFDKVIKSFGEKRVLNKLTFSVNKGDIFFFIGYSGSGKSVSLQNLTGLMIPESGSIKVAGQEIVGMDDRELSEVRRNMGFLFQSGALINWLTVAENVDLPLREHTSMSRRQRREVVLEKLKLVNLADDGDKYPSEISGGMKKRASLARAIALDPDIVLFDEPTSGLDPVYARQIDELTAAINKVLGITCVIVTHDMESVYDVGTRVGFFLDGEMAFIGTPDELKSCDNEKVKYFISGGKSGSAKTERKRITEVIRAQPRSMRRAQVKDERESARTKLLEGETSIRRIKKGAKNPAFEQEGAGDGVEQTQNKAVIENGTKPVSNSGSSPQSAAPTASSESPASETNS